MRLCQLAAMMALEERMERARKVPSAYSQLKAEFGFIGTRQQVLEAAFAECRKDET